MKCGRQGNPAVLLGPSEERGPARGGGAPRALINGVSDGARTRDHRNHNPVLYQLSYTHHKTLQLSPSPASGHVPGGTSFFDARHLPGGEREQKK